MATKNQTKQPRNQAPKAAESQTNDQAAAEHAAKVAKQEAWEHVVMVPHVLQSDHFHFSIRGANVLDTVIHLVDHGYPVVLVQEPEGAYRAMLAAFGPMLTGPVGLDVEQAMKNLEEATPEILAGFKAMTGEDMPAKPLDGCVHGELTLEEYLAQPANEWAPYWGKREKPRGEAGQGADGQPTVLEQSNEVMAAKGVIEPQRMVVPMVNAGSGFCDGDATKSCRTIMDEAAMRVILAARKGGQNERHEERTATRLTVATRTNEGIRLRVVENPDAHMDEILNRQANQGDRPVLHDRLAYIGKRLETIRSEMDARLSSVTGAKKWRDRVVAVLLGEAEPEPGDLEKFEAMDPAVTGPMREHVSEFERLDDEAAQIEEQLARMDKELAAKQRVATVLMDEVIPVDAEVAMHLYTV